MTEECVEVHWDTDTVIDRDVPVDRRVIDALLAALSSAIAAAAKGRRGSRTSRKACELVCHLGREVVRAVILSPAGWWNENNRAEDSARLLRDAMGSTEGSRYHANCCRRPDALDRALAVSRAETESWQSTNLEPETTKMS